MRIGLQLLASIALAFVGCGDGDVVELSITMENIARADALVSGDNSEHPVAFAPGIRVVHAPNSGVLFQVGVQAGPELEQLAEDGNPQPLIDSLVGFDAESFAREDMATYQDGPLEPNTSATITVFVTPGEQISIASMFGQSNDIFVAAVDLEPFPNGLAAGDITSLFAYFDAGTEQNEEPGIGENQAPRQSGPGAGQAEDGPVTKLDENIDVNGFGYPAITEVLRVTISAAPAR